MSSNSMMVEGPLSARAVVLEWYLDEAADLASRSTFEPGLIQLPLNEVHWQQYVHWSRRLYSAWVRPMRQVAFSQSPVTACWPGTEPFCAEVIVHNLFQRIWHALLLSETHQLRQRQHELSAGMTQTLLDCDYLTQKLQQFEQTVLRYIDHQPASNPLLKLHQLCRQWGDQAVELLLRDLLSEPEDEHPDGAESILDMISGAGDHTTPLEAILPMELEINQLLQQAQFQSQPRAHFHRALLMACGKLCKPVEKM